MRAEHAYCAGHRCVEGGLFPVVPDPVAQQLELAVGHLKLLLVTGKGEVGARCGMSSQHVSDVECREVVGIDDDDGARSSPQQSRAADIAERLLFDQ